MLINVIISQRSTPNSDTRIFDYTVLQNNRFLLSGEAATLLDALDNIRYDLEHIL